MPARILHIDMDAFFASVEQVLNPSLLGKPLIIGGDKTDVRGVVSTASYEARKFGVHSGMPLIEAKRLCPRGVFMRGNFAHYQKASTTVRTILDEVSPWVEMASIDEAYVDVTGSLKLFGGEEAIGAYLKRRIREDTGLPCTVAIAPNRLLSKVAAGEAKPDGFARVLEGEEAAYLRPLPIRKLLGVGPQTSEVLENLGITTIGALANLPLEALLRVFGPGGYSLRRAAQGIGWDGIFMHSQPKSISRETTFEKNLLDWRVIERILMYLAERSAYALREQAMETRTVVLKVRYADFTTRTFSKALEEPTSLDVEITGALRTLIPKAKERRLCVRLIGVCLSSLSGGQRQMRLFGTEQCEKWTQALEGVDAARRKHGFECLRSAKSMALGAHVHLATPSLSR